LGSGGLLGYGNTNNIGDDETPASAGDVPVLSADELSAGVSVAQITAGTFHTCALLSTGNVRCWGGGGLSGQLGYGNLNTIGDDETPDSAGDVDVGGPVVQITAGVEHTCALLETGAVRCWGRSDLGQLGYGNLITIGDDETPATAGDVVVF
jgi:alpha-tubulin suppressor-like RCC1 family protein